MRQPAETLKRAMLKKRKRETTAAAQRNQRHPRKVTRAVLTLSSQSLASKGKSGEHQKLSQMGIFLPIIGLRSGHKFSKELKADGLMSDVSLTCSLMGLYPQEDEIQRILTKHYMKPERSSD
ncbi:MAG: hypothetical protein EBT12_15680 [Marivivens sp.]|nr:hypothetical protein [Marivivens sp.]